MRGLVVALLCLLCFVHPPAGIGFRHVLEQGLLDARYGAVADGNRVRVRQLVLHHNALTLGSICESASPFFSIVD